MASGDDEKDVCEPIQMILFGNESVEATFRDRSKIQITACGTAFVHDQPAPSDGHVLHGPTRTVHRTEFTTSSYQLKVIKTLAFKNRYSARPFLCSTLPSKNQSTVMYEDVQHARWPLSIADRRCDIIVSNGTLSMTSLDGHASLTLAAHGRTFVVRYLAKMSANVGRSRGESGDQDDVSDTASTCSGSTVKWAYTRVSLHHSVEDCPTCWQHPLQLLLQFRQEDESFNNNNNNTTDSSINKTTIDDILERKLKKLNLSESIGEETSIEEENGNKTVLTSLPPSLDLTCSGKHLHKWRSVASQKTSDDLDDCCMYSHVKVVYTPNAVFRIVYSSPRHIEIYPTDGSIIVSRGTESGYYDHYFLEEDGVEDRTYSIKCPPPNSPSFAYSVKQLLLTADRLLRCVNIMMGAPKQEICWQASSTVAPPVNARNLIVEDRTVENVANFQATRNGRVRVLFTDRTRVDLRLDLDKAKRLCSERGVEFEVEEVLPYNCRVMNTLAEYEQVSLHHSTPYDRYLEAVKDWVAWVVTPVEDRPETFTLNARHMARQASIEQELKKIKCFNYILDNVVLNTVEDVHDDDDKKTDTRRQPDGAHQNGTDVTKRNGSSDDRVARDGHVAREGHVALEEAALSPAMVADILRRNKMAIKEIDKLTSPKV